MTLLMDNPDSEPVAPGTTLNSAVCDPMLSELYEKTLTKYSRPFWIGSS